MHVQEIKTRMLFGSRQENVYLFFWSSPRWLDASNLTRYPQSQGLTPFQQHAKILNLSGPNCLFISLGPQASCSGLRTFVFIIFLTSKQGSQDLHFSRESNDIRVLISWIVRLPLVYRENADSDLGCFEEEADPPWPTTCVCVCVFHIIRSPPWRETASAFDSTAIAQWHSLSERSLPLHSGVGRCRTPLLSVSRIADTPVPCCRGGGARNSGPLQNTLALRGVGPGFERCAPPLQSTPAFRHGFQRHTCSL